MNSAMTITVTEGDTAYFFSLVPMTSLDEFVENVGLLTKCSDVQLGVEMGWWKVA